MERMFGSVAEGLVELARFDSQHLLWSYRSLRLPAILAALRMPVPKHAVIQPKYAAMTLLEDVERMSGELGLMKSAIAYRPGMKKPEYFKKHRDRIQGATCLFLQEMVRCIASLWYTTAVLAYFLLRRILLKSNSYFVQITEWFGQAQFALEAQDAWFERKTSTMIQSLRLYHQQGLTPAGIREVTTFQTATKAIKGLLQQLGDQCFAMDEVSRFCVQALA
jgi:hypothetical protein